MALFEKRLRRLRGVMAERFALDPMQLEHVCQEDDAPVPFLPVASVCLRLLAPLPPLLHPSSAPLDTPVGRGTPWAQCCAPPLALPHLLHAIPPPSPHQVIEEG